MLKKIKLMTDEQIRNRIFELDDRLYDLDPMSDKANDMWVEQEQLLHELKVVRNLPELV